MNYFPRSLSRPLRSVFAASLLFAAILLAAAGTAAAQIEQGPVIIIPGLTGSELINKKTGEHVWFKTPRSKDDDLRLPISVIPSKNQDNLVPGDILRSIKFGIFPKIDFYDGLIKSLETKAGYHEEKWDSPTADGVGKAIYVFPYDWRLDNVANARLLISKISELKLKLKRPNLKFNVIAHSMGGIIARYAAMYGNADLPLGSSRIQPTWAGAKHFDKLVLLGTPNEGSILALSTMINGWAIAGINIELPWIQKVNKFDMFTIPSSYQLLPAPGTFHVLDENFDPIEVNLYDPKEWTKYGWNTIDDPRFEDHYTAAERRAAPKFFALMLDRSRRLHAALAATGTGAPPVSINIVGAECRDSLDSIVLIRDVKSKKWKTFFKAPGFTKPGGEKVSGEDMKKAMYLPGDGVVTERSLRAETESSIAKVDSILYPKAVKLVCSDHNKLAANVEIQDYLVGLLTGR